IYSTLYLIITNMQYYKNISSYIKQRRLNKGVSLNEFAIENELEPATLSRYENGKRSISLMNMVKIANGFEQTLAEFLADFEKEYNL
ncbi:helix-turn-helix transcriptional regulator, partial [bacterium]|nr:helix-turn-helix transcriptional regulator [bacterium]